MLHRTMRSTFDLPLAMVLLCAYAIMLLLSASCSDEPGAPATSTPTSCLLASDCPLGQTCVNLVCVVAGANNAAPTCTQADCPCAADADCPIGLICADETDQCAPAQCQQDADCALGSACSAGRCVVDVEADRDRDGVPDGSPQQPRDNCPDLANTDQEDADADGAGDLCDGDDDNDGVGDAADNCPTLANLPQSDADNDGVGNRCDEDAPATSVTGRLDGAAGGSPDPGRAIVTLSGVEAPLAVDAEGRFVATHALPDGGPFAVQVQWEGFVPLSAAFVAPANVASFDVGTLTLTPQSQSAEQAVSMAGRVTLGGQTRHDGVIVRATVGGRTVATTVTAADGSWAFLASRTAHHLNFQKAGYTEADADVTFDGASATFRVNDTPLESWEGARLELIQDASLTGALDAALIEGGWSAIASVRVWRSVEGAEIYSLPITDDGAFRLEGVPPGNYNLVAEALGHNPYLNTNLVLTSGTTDMGIVTLVPILYNVVGRVALLDGGNPTGASLRAYRSFDGIFADNASSDRDGQFGISMLPTAHRIDVSLPNYIPQSITIGWSGTGFTLGGQPLEADTIVATLSPEPLIDTEQDGFYDYVDNCPLVINPDQSNIDGDALGDACDPDIDDDHVPNGIDNCLYVANLAQEEGPLPGIGAACSLGLPQAPIDLDRSILRLNVNTLRRGSQLDGSCGGSNVGEVVFNFAVTRDEALTLDVKAAFGVVTYILTPDGDEVACRGGKHLEINTGTPDAVALNTGSYQLVVDGFALGAEGPMTINAFREHNFTTISGGNLAACAGMPCNRRPDRSTLFDLNGDGEDDIIVANFDIDEPPTRRFPFDVNLSGPGGRRWAPPIQTAADLTIHAQGADLDGDGFGDIIALTRSEHLDAAHFGSPDFVDGRMELFFGGAPSADGSMSFTAGPAIDLQPTVPATIPRIEFTLIEPYDVVAIDVDDNGLRDLVVSANATTVVVDIQSVIPLSFTVTTGLQPGRLYVYTQSAPRAFGFSQIISTGSVPLNITEADMDLDGRLDVVVGALVSSSIEIFYNEGDGTLRARERGPIDVSFIPQDIVVTDANFDGLPDLLSANEVGGRLERFFQTPSGEFVQGSVALNSQQQNLALSDVDRDGVPDVILSRVIPNPEEDDNIEDQILVLFGQGDGSFYYGEDTRAALSRFTASALVLDFDQDRTLDILSPHRWSKSMDIAVGHSPLKLRPAQTLASNPARQGTARPAGVLGAELNGDGYTDLALVNFSSDTLVLYHGEASGGFGAPVTLSTEPGPFYVTTAELNGDGRLDLIVAHLGSNYITSYFSPLSDLSSCLPPRCERLALPLPVATTVAPADFTRDGVLDLAVAASDAFYIFRGRVEGGRVLFDPVAHQSTEVSGDTYAVNASDVDNDTHPDLLVTTFNGQASVWYNDGAGHVGRPGSSVDCPHAYILPTTPTGDCPDTPAPALREGFECVAPTFAGVVDLAGPGSGDFVLGCLNTDNVLVAFRDAVQSPRNPSPYTRFAALADIGQPTSVASFDLDQDGFGDLAITQSSQQSVALARTTRVNGQLTVALHQSIPVGRSPTGVWMGSLTDSSDPASFAVVNGNQFDDTLTVSRPLPTGPNRAAGTRIVETPLEACPPQAVTGQLAPDGSAVSFDFSAETPCEAGPDGCFQPRRYGCRLERAELRAELPSARRAAPVTLLLETVEGPLQAEPLRLLEGAPPTTSLWTAAALPALARLEGSLLHGRWTVQALVPGCDDAEQPSCRQAGALSGLTLWINRPTADPLEPTGEPAPNPQAALPRRAAPCVSGLVDQPDTELPHLDDPALSSPCRWDQRAQLDAALHGSNDTDAVLLDPPNLDANAWGTLAFASWLSNPTLSLCVRFAADPAGAPQITLNPLGSPAALATATPAQGIARAWNLVTTVDTAFWGRYLVLRVIGSAPDATPLGYSISSGTCR